MFLGGSELISEIVGLLFQIGGGLARLLSIGSCAIGIRAEFLQLGVIHCRCRYDLDGGFLLGGSQLILEILVLFLQVGDLTG